VSIYEGLRPLKLLGSLLEVVRVFFRKDGFKIEWKPNQAHTYSGDMTYEFPAPDSATTVSDVLVSENSSQTVTNKALNFAAGGNVATDLPLSSLKADEDARNKVILRNSVGVPVNALIGQQHLDGALTDVISGKVNVSALTTETTARQAADAALSTRVGTLEEGGGVDVSALTSETSARTAADSALGTRIDGEASARITADGALGTRIDTEVTARTSAVASAVTTAASYTDAQVAALVNSAPATLDTLKEIADQLAADESAAAALVTTVGTKATASALTSETSARTAADSALGTRIDTEASARAAADWTLTTRFSALEFGSAVWYPADGATKTITHPYNSINLEVHILDVDNELIYIDSVKSPALNTLVLRASVAPAASTYWTIFYRKLQ